MTEDRVVMSDSERLHLLYLGADPRVWEQCAVDDEFFPKQIKKHSEIGLLDSSFSPDLVLMDHSIVANSDVATASKWMGQIRDRANGIDDPPFCIVFFDSYPSNVTRDELYEIGIDDFIVLPFSIQELHHKLKFFLRSKKLLKAHGIMGHRLDRSFEYLDRFESILKTTKEELMDEKSSLNNALKQIQHMTSQRHRMEEQIKSINQKNRSNEEGMENLLRSLIEAGIEKNRGHGSRVAQISSFLGNALGIKGKKLDDLQKAAILHEIGLLTHSSHEIKMEKDSNFQGGRFLEKYPVKGAELLSKCQYFQGCAKILQHMNENSDGTGFPGGLKRKDIPLESRILAAADAFDTLRQGDNDGLSVLSSLDEMAGSRLDPMVVKQLEVYITQHPDAPPGIRGVGIDQLEPGMELGSALFTEGGTKLFSMGTVLTSQLIEKLVQYSREYPVNETVYIKA